MSSTISISEETQRNFDLKSLEKFVNSEEFADVVLGNQMLQGETGSTITYSAFKKELGLLK